MNAIVQQFQAFWKRQKTSEKVTLIALVLAAAILIPILVTWATKTTYAVAFSGLSEADAGAIVEELTTEGISYKLDGSSTILVPSDQVYNVRLKMASAGLPQTGTTVGYELFDATSLGMTEFTQKVNYQRAVQGELERTIGSLNAIEAVSVHIVVPEKTLLSSTQKEPTASIMVKTKSGTALDSGQVRAITHLVSASIEGLKSENVVVVDSEGNMLASGATTGSDAAAAAVTDSRRTAELAAAKDIQYKAQQMLDSVLGPDKAIVQANVTLDWTQREVTSQTFDPTPSAIRSSSVTSETYTTNGTTTGGVPGATSNLPTPVATATGGTGSTNYQKTDTTTNYELASTQSHELIEPGQIKQISVSVLVDSITDPTQLNVLKNAVSAAVGIDAERGDSLSVESIVFDRTFYTDQVAEMEAASKTSMYIKYGEIGGAVLLFIILLLYVQKLLKNLKLASNDAWVPVMKNVSDNALRAPQMAPMISPTIPVPQMATISTQVEMPVPKQRISAEDEQMQKVMTRLSEDSPASVAEIIQLWLAEDEK
ncbi:MAG: flagellar M-ring protein FliF [Chloroflexi bacterium HGW-Chloroflexi-4]|jgi:flagellar M-ring protein FliF|nr:MAG: flagellar M-ring protein FliF [Chloroflexi bacterium HGW-Chloroflexi-4]